MSAPTGIRALVEVLTQALADRPGEVRVTEAERRGATVIEVKMAPEEVGRLIGRQGRTAAALRTLASLAGEKEGKTVTVEIKDR